MQEEPCDCDHHFIRDLIDITPDYSKEIIYCEYCEHTPPFFYNEVQKDCYGK
jgi:hypothetical protein